MAAYRLKPLDKGRKRIINTTTGVHVCEIDNQGRIRGIDRHPYIEYLNDTHSNPTCPEYQCSVALPFSMYALRLQDVDNDLNFSIEDIIDWQSIEDDGELRVLFPDNQPYMKQDKLGDKTQFADGMDTSETCVDIIGLEDKSDGIKWIGGVTEHSIEDADPHMEYLIITPECFNIGEFTQAISAKGFKAMMMDKCVIMLAFQHLTGLANPMKKNHVMDNSLFGIEKLPLTMRNMYTLLSLYLSILQGVLEPRRDNVGTDTRIMALTDREITVEATGPSIWKYVPKSKKDKRRGYTAIIENGTGRLMYASTRTSSQPYMTQTVRKINVTRTKGGKSWQYGTYKLMHRRSDRIPKRERVRVKTAPQHHMVTKKIKILGKRLQDFCTEVRQYFNTLGNAKFNSDNKSQKVAKGKTLDHSNEDVKNTALGGLRNTKGSNTRVKSSLDPARERRVTNVVGAANLTTTGPRSKKNGGGNGGTAMSQLLGIVNKQTKRLRGDPPINMKAGKDGQVKKRPTKNNIELTDEEIYTQQFQQLTASAVRTVPPRDTGTIMGYIRSLWQHTTPETLEVNNENLRTLGAWMTWVYTARFTPVRGLSWWSAIKCLIDLDLEPENRRLRPASRVHKDMEQINEVYAGLHCTDTVSWMSGVEHATAFLGGCFDQRVSAPIFQVMLGMDPNDRTGSGTGPNCQCEYGNYNKQLLPGMITGSALMEILPLLQYYPQKKGDAFVKNLPSFSSSFVSPMGMTGQIPNPLSMASEGVSTADLQRKIKEEVEDVGTIAATVWCSVKKDDDKYVEEVIGSVDIPAVSKDSFGVLGSSDIRIVDGNITLANKYILQASQWISNLQKLDKGICDNDALKAMAEDYPLGDVIDDSYQPTYWNVMANLIVVA